MHLALSCKAALDHAPGRQTPSRYLQGLPAGSGSSRQPCLPCRLVVWAQQHMMEWGQRKPRGNRAVQSQIRCETSERRCPKVDPPDPTGAMRAGFAGFLPLPLPPGQLLLDLQRHWVLRLTLSPYRSALHHPGDCSLAPGGLSAVFSSAQSMLDPATASHRYPKAQHSGLLGPA